MKSGWTFALLLCAAGCDDGGDGDPAVDVGAGDTGARDMDAGSDDGGVEPDGATGDEGTDAALQDAASDIGEPVPDGGADAGADADTPDPDAGADAPFTPCTSDTRVGGFEVSLRNGFTAVQGQVFDAVNVNQVQGVTAEDGPCQLLQPITRFCEPSCGAGQTCGDGGVCAPTPTATGVGTVGITGLEGAVSMTASAPVWFYTNRDPLDHPGFVPEADIRLTASGVDPVAPFAVVGWGVTPLEVTTEEFVLEVGTPALLEWETPADAGPARVHVELNIANHGGTPGRIVCDVDDTGRFEIPAPLTEQLLGFGFSGFPAVSITRRTVDSADTAVGCVDLRVQSQITLDVTIPGLTSCSDDADCPEAEICQPDLTCG